MCKLDSQQRVAYAHSARPSGRQQPWLWPAILLGLVGVVLLASLLPLPPLPAPAASIPASGSAAAVAVHDPSPPTINQKELLAALVRYGARPEGPSPAHFPALDVLLATPMYFAFTGRQPPVAALEQPSLIFYVSESVHVDELPALPPQPLLKVGRVYHQSTEVTALTNSPHHRTTLVRYRATWSDGLPITTPQEHSLELVFAAASGGDVAGSVLSWELPISYGPNYSSGEVFLRDASPALSADVPDSHDGHLTGGHDHGLAPNALPPLGTSPLTLLAIPALLGVMLAALTPCLIDLALYYGAYLGGAGAAAGLRRVSLVRSALVKSALFFILGFTLVYTAGGAVAGQAGQVLQRLGLVLEWSRPISIIAGMVVILVALRMAAGFRIPLVCRLPLPSLSIKIGSGALRSTLMGSTFAARCFSCFSGTMLSALILYAGASGSPLTGALLLLSFSLGLGAILLLAALLMTSFVPVTFGLKRLRPFLGLASALIMVGFGVAMILDKEHIFTGYLYRVLNLG